MATYPAMPPFNFINSGKMSGLEPALLSEWANRRNWRLEFLVMDFAAQIPAVQTGKADMAVGAISTTEERQKQVLFSDLRAPHTQCHQGLHPAHPQGGVRDWRS